MAFSALFILIFHLWINITNLPFERYIRELCVIGVDLFFFVSAYSIAKIKRGEYKKFILNRFKTIYIKFIIFSLIGTIYLGWDIIKFLKVILGVELFTKGGGSFLWFIPSIMLVYLVLPLYKILDNKYPKVVPFLAILINIITSILISSYTNYNAIFILINRVPIILLGYYFAKYNIFSYLRENKAKYWFITITSLVIGLLISYLVYVNHFSITWYYDIFYILYIPLNIGTILLLDRLEVNKVSEHLSSISLELYGIQMLFGFKIATIILKYLHVKLLSNIFTIIILILISMIIHEMFNLKDKVYKTRLNH